MPDRTYTGEEVAAIFARASERQHSGSPRERSHGLTLAEIEQAGLEAGLDAASVRAAATELDVERRYPSRSKVVVAERWIEGPIAAGAWEDLVASLRHRFGTSTAGWGRDTASLGESQEWTHAAASGVHTTVTLSPREGPTLLRVVQEGAGLEDERTAGGLMAGFVSLLPAIVVGALVAEALALGDFAGVAAAIMVVLAGAALGGPWFAARERARRVRLAEQVQSVADDLVRQLSEPTQTAPRASVESSEPRLDLSEGSDPTPAADSTPERRRTRS